MLSYVVYIFFKKKEFLITILRLAHEELWETPGSLLEGR